MIFSFTAQYTGVYESLWLFSIPTIEQSQPILIVASAKEPSVAFASPKLSLNPTVFGKSFNQNGTIIILTIQKVSV
jgi:hypothetical protein